MIGLSRLGYQQRVFGRRMATSLVVNATTPTVQTIPLVLHQQTDVIEVRIKRPTTLKPLNWDATSTITVQVKVMVDGVQYGCTGQTTGGIRGNGVSESPEYVLRYRPTWGYFGGGPGTMAKRLGEGSTTYQAVVEITRSSGSIETEVSIRATNSEAPSIPFTNSVAFDAATDVLEAAGDGTVTLSHTCAGSDRAAFIGVGNGAWTTAGSSTPPTYNGVSSTELWDTTFSSIQGSSGNRLVAPATGAQTVSSTLTGYADLFEHALAVVTFTGVDQTTPVGTPQTATGTSTTPSVTVTDATTGDMVVDFVNFNGSAPSVGANQTQRTTESGTFSYASSTQAGADGGVMSWSDISSGEWIAGAVTMKQSGAAAAKKRMLPGLLVQRAISMRP